MTTSATENLHLQIWNMANSVRGAVDGWDFKQYVLGTLFYRFISEDFANYMNGDDKSIDYASLSDDVITPDLIDDSVKTKGFFIYPSQLFTNMVADGNRKNIASALSNVFSDIENSAIGYPSQEAMKGLFSDFDTSSGVLGSTLIAREARLFALLNGVDNIDFGNVYDGKNNLYYEAFSLLISHYSHNSGVHGGNLHTPHGMAELVMRLAAHNQDTVNRIYDPVTRDGSLLLQAYDYFGAYNIESGLFGQVNGRAAFNIARMTMFMRGINYQNFNLVLADPLTKPHYNDQDLFDMVVSNPPYSMKWPGNSDAKLSTDDRFVSAGAMAPKTHADLAFVLHSLSYLSDKGRAAIVCFPGALYRDGSENKIRQHLVDNNYVDCVISLAPKILIGSSMSMSVLVLSKHKLENTVQFIDASELCTKHSHGNILESEHIAQILQAFDARSDVLGLSKVVSADEISANNYNLLVGSYVEPAPVVCDGSSFEM